MVVVVVGGGRVVVVGGNVVVVVGGTVVVVVVVVVVGGSVVVVMGGRVVVVVGWVVKVVVARTVVVVAGGRGGSVEVAAGGRLVEVDVVAAPPDSVVEGCEVVEVDGAAVVSVAKPVSEAMVVPVVVDVPLPSAARMSAVALMSSVFGPAASPGTVVNWMPSTVDTTGLEGPVSASAATKSAPPIAVATMTRRAQRFTNPASNRSSTAALPIARHHYTRC